MDAQSQIKDTINQYAQSVNELDLEKAKTLWIDIPEISFVHPRGHEKGKEQIIRAFYQETMGRFSKRRLTPKDIDIAVIGDTAFVVFYWEFNAIFADDGSAHQTKGRETQVMKKTDDGWKILHIHYSGLPVTGDREGF